MIINSIKSRIANSWIVSKRRDVHKIKVINSSDDQVRYFNFGWEFEPKNFWFSRFLNCRTSLLKSEKQIAIFSCFGNRERLKYAKGDIRLFWTGENIRSNIMHFLPYADNMMNDPSIDLSLGFDYFEDDRYMRFPLWLLYMLKAEASDEEIRERVAKLQKPEIGERSRFCSMVASHDFKQIRENITNQMSAVEKVSCGGKFMHNDDTLKIDCKDNKAEYLRQFAFNICPENTNAYGYCTEKIFESIRSGCIPVYWGSYNEPEPRIINKDAVIFFEPGKDNSKQIAFVEELYTHPKQLLEFMNQDRLLPTAEEEILRMIHELSDKFSALL